MSVLQSLGVLMLFVMAFNSLGVFLSFLFRTAYVVVEFYLGIIVAPLFFIGILGLAATPAGDMISFLCLTTHATRFAHMPGMYPADIVTGLAVCLAFIVIPTAIGIYRFKKAEIK